MSDQVHVFLDVDGVINAVNYQQPRGGFSEYINVFASGLQVLYSPALVQRLNALAARPNVVMHWLTTWEDNAADDLSPAIGLDGRGWEVVGIHEHRTEARGDWWKLDAISDWVDDNPDTLAIWIDDDIDDEPLAVDWIAQQPNVLSICPRPMRGLTPREVARIESWVSEAAA